MSNFFIVQLQIFIKLQTFILVLVLDLDLDLDLHLNLHFPLTPWCLLAVNPIDLLHSNLLIDCCQGWWCSSPCSLQLLPVFLASFRTFPRHILATSFAFMPAFSSFLKRQFSSCWSFVIFRGDPCCFLQYVFANIFVDFRFIISMNQLLICGFSY